MLLANRDARTKLSQEILSKEIRVQKNTRKRGGKKYISR